MDSDDNSLPSPPQPNIPAPVLPPPVPPRSKKSEETQQSDDILEDEEISQHMTQSYSEISFKSDPEAELSPVLNLDTDDIAEHNFKQRPNSLECKKSLGPLNLEGTVHVEGNMTHFVAEDLEYKIKLSSPVTKKGDISSGTGTSRSGTPNTLYRQLLVPQVSQIDTALINDLENEAHRMATSVDSLIENLSEILHSISSITADNVDVYKNAVSKMSDAMDGNIKSMYTLMAKAEEITQNMKVVERHSVRIKEIKRLVDLFESFV